MARGNVKKLSDGTEVTLRLLCADDTDKLYQFFSTLSAKARQFLYDDITDRKVVEAWTTQANYDHVVPIVAEINGEIIADGTLHKRNNGPSRHMGRIRVVVREDYYGRGLGSLITQELSVIAKARKLTYLYVSLAERGEAAAIEAAEKQGFTRTTILPNFLIDLEGNFDNSVIYMKSI